MEGAAHHAPEAEQDGGPAEPAQRPRDHVQGHGEEAQEDERDHQHEERGRDEQERVGGEVAEEVFGDERAALAQLVEEEGAHAHEHEVEVVAQEEGLARRAREALLVVHHARPGGAVGGPEEGGEGEHGPQRGHAEGLGGEGHAQQLALAQVGEGRGGAEQADHPGGQQGAEHDGEDGERRPLDEVDGHDLAEARAAALEERDLARLALHQHRRHQHEVVEGDADDEQHQREERQAREEQLLLVLRDDGGEFGIEHGEFELRADGAIEGAQVALDLLRVAAVDAPAVDEGVGLEGAVDGGQVGRDHVHERALVDDEGERGPARGIDDEAAGVAEPDLLAGVVRLDQPGDGDLDGVDVVAPEGVEVEDVAGADAELAGGGGAHPDLDAGTLGGVGGGRRGGGGAALDERDARPHIGEEEEVGAGAQVVVVVHGLARLGQEEGGGAPVEAGLLDEAARVAPEEGRGDVAALAVDLGLAGLAVADHLEVEVERLLLAEGEAEAEVAHGVGVEDDAGHEGGGEDHAEDDGGEQPPVGEAPLGDDPEEGGEAGHGRRASVQERPRYGSPRSGDVVVGWVADGFVVRQIQAVTPGRGIAQAQFAAFPAGEPGCGLSAFAPIAGGDELEGGEQVRVGRADDAGVVGVINGAGHEVDGQLDVDALLLGALVGPPARIAQGPGDDDRARPFPGGALAHVGGVGPGILTPIGTPNVNADLFECSRD